MAGWIKALRRSFVAEEGFSLAAFDYSQVELRILASVSGDEKMLDAFARSLDIHKMTTAQIFNVPLSEVTPKMRNVAKTLNFGVVYGMGPLSFAKTSGLSRDEAKNSSESTLTISAGENLAGKNERRRRRSWDS